MYSDWASVPESYKEVNPRFPIRAGRAPASSHSGGDRVPASAASPFDNEPRAVEALGGVSLCTCPHLCHC